MQAIATHSHKRRLTGSWQGDGAARTTVLVDGHLNLTLETQRYRAVAAQPTQGAVVGEDPVEQACADVVNQWLDTGLTAWVS